MKIRDFAKEVISIIPTIHAKVIRGQPKELMKGKITFPQMVIIDLLRVRKECKMSDIAKILRVTKSAVTGITDRMIRTSLLKRIRSRRDRRIVKIRLTPKGTRLSNRLINYKLKIIRGVFSNISQRERLQYLSILRKLQKNIIAKAGNKLYA